LTHQGGCNINFLIIQDAGLAQSVEQRTENPRVPGSIPGPGTFKIKGLANMKLAPFSLLVTNL
jgi:hypothetical protein